MDKINHCWPFIVIIVIMFLFFLFFDFLRRKDMKIDYTNKIIRYYIENNNGVDYIIIPYLFWQEGKLNAIKTMFSDRFEYEGRFLESNFYIIIKLIFPELMIYFPKDFTEIANL